MRPFAKQRLAIWSRFDLVPLMRLLKLSRMTLFCSEDSSMLSLKFCMAIASSSYMLLWEGFFLPN